MNLLGVRYSLRFNIFIYTVNITVRPVIHFTLRVDLYGHFEDKGGNDGVLPAIGTEPTIFINSGPLLKQKWAGL